jgi:pimeloyl-ACP methyl ester carboxylesterase
MTLGAITGQAAGVPFVALAPSAGERAEAPVVVAWHLLDSPRTEQAFAAAVPLDGLDAWRIYFGLPLSGARTPAGGPEELMRLGFEDAVLKLHWPIVSAAVAEFPAAFAELRERLELAAGPVGVMGGSLGAAVAQLVLAESGRDFAAAVLLSPVVQLRGAVEAGGRRFGVSYPWSEESGAVADRLDFVARAGEFGDTPVLLVVGEEDDEGFREPAAALASVLPRAELVTIPAMGHALAEEPGLEAAAQTPPAKAVDRAAVDWFERAFQSPNWAR